MASNLAKLTILLLPLLLALPHFAKAGDVGFTSGSQFTSTQISGEINVQCQTMGSDPGGPAYAHFYCQDVILDPVESDYFVGPTGVHADHVTLAATHSDGKKKTGKQLYNSSKGTSTYRFNLWRSSLLNNAILDIGTNQVHYSMISKRNIVAAGDFTVVINDGGERTCRRTGNYMSQDSNDCRSGQRLCDQYFYENHYCI